VDAEIGQITLASVLLAMVGGSFLIRFNQAIAGRLAGAGSKEDPAALTPLSDKSEKTVLIAGYGRVGHTIAVLLHNSGVPFIAFDADPRRVEQGRADGYQVLYGDVSDPGLLLSVQVERMALVIITVGDPVIALRVVSLLRDRCPQVPVIARARDLKASGELTEAGAAHAHPELIEASLRLGATALRMLRMPSEDVDLILQGIRDWDYLEVLEPETAPAGEDLPRGS
jgi:CPA2 family monovalent cation:H+ antiporter-2